VFKQLLFFVALFSCTHAFAADGSSESKQTTLLDDFYVNVISIVHGPGVNNLDQPYTPNADGKTVPKATSAMNFDSELTAAYMITDTVGVGPDVPFLAYPVLGKGFSLGDVGIKAFDKKFISNSALAVYANIIFQLPTSDYSSGRDMSFAIKMTPNLRYIIADTRFMVGVWTEEKAYMGVNAGKTAKLYAQPYVNYQVTHKFSWNLGFEAEADHFYGKPNFDLTMYQTDLMPGFVYVVTPKLIVNPYFQVFTSQKVSLNNTALGAFLSASL